MLPSREQEKNLLLEGIENCRLIGLSLKNVVWTRVRFNGVRFYGVNFADSIWNEVNLNRCSFRNCRFIGTQISGVKMRDLKISHVDFSGLTITSSEEFTEVFMNHQSHKISPSNKD